MKKKKPTINIWKRESLKVKISKTTKAKEVHVKAKAIQVDPTIYMSWKEKKLWKRLSDKKKQAYIEEAQRKVYVKMQRKKQDAIVQIVESDKKHAVRAPRVSSSNINTIATNSNHAETLSAKVIDGETKTSREIVQNLSQKNWDVVVPASSTAGIGKEITKQAIQIARQATFGEEQRKEYQKDNEIATLTAQDFQADTHGFLNTVKMMAMIFASSVTAMFSVVLPILLAIILAIAILSSIIGAVMGIIWTEQNKNSGGKRIVQVALKEEELGEDATRGGTKYWQYMGFTSRVEWCASFVSWCGNECGYVESGIMPKSASVRAYRDWYEEKGLYRLKENYTPKVGDLMIQLSAGTSHIGIVQFVEGDRVVTIEGNTSDIVHTRSYRLTDEHITGYCVPNYPSESDFTGNSNAEIAWNFLKSKGCSDEVVAGILGNLQQESGIDPTKRQYGGGPGRGICQWEEGSMRFSRLIDQAHAMGKQWTDIEPQLEYLWWELSGGEATCAYILERDYGGFGNFINAKDVHWATLAFEKSFERAGKPNMAKRYEYADMFYAQFANK